MAGLHQGDEANSSANGDESIAHKCRVLNEKLDQLLGTLHEEASPVHTATPRISLDEDDLADTIVVDLSVSFILINLTFVSSK